MKIAILFGIALISTTINCYIHQADVNRCFAALDAFFKDLDPVYGTPDIDIPKLNRQADHIFTGPNGDGLDQDCLPEKLEFKGFDLHDDV